MKKFLFLICVGLMFCSSAIAETTCLDLEPGVYRVGKDIEEGEWEIHFTNSDFSTRIDYGQMKEDGTFDISYPNFFSISLMMKWTENPKITVYLMEGDDLQISYSSCSLYQETDK